MKPTPDRCKIPKCGRPVTHHKRVKLCNACYSGMLRLQNAHLTPAAFMDRLWQRERLVARDLFTGGAAGLIQAAAPVKKRRHLRVAA